MVGMPVSTVRIRCSINNSFKVAAIDRALDETSYHGVDAGVFSFGSAHKLLQMLEQLSDQHLYFVFI